MKFSSSRRICCYGNRGLVNLEREYQLLPPGTNILLIPQFFYMPDQILGKKKRKKNSIFRPKFDLYLKKLFLTDLTQIVKMNELFSPTPLASQVLYDHCIVRLKQVFSGLCNRRLRYRWRNRGGLTFVYFLPLSFATLTFVSDKLWS